MSDSSSEKMAVSKKTWRWILLALLLCGALAAIGLYNVRAAGAGPAVGTLAPDFTLPSQSGSQVSLHDLRGKWVVLYFYPKDMSHGCTIEAHDFERDEANYSAKNAIIVGISTDSVESHQKFCVKEGLTFKLLSDADHKVSKEYGSLLNFGVTEVSSRHTFLISPDGKVARVFLDVNPSSHSDEVLAALTELEGSKS